MKIKRIKVLGIVKANIASKQRAYANQLQEFDANERERLAEAVDEAKLDLARAEKELAATKRKEWTSDRYGRPRRPEVSSLESLLSLIEASDDEEISLSPKIEKMLGL